MEGTLDIRIIELESRPYNTETDIIRILFTTHENNLEICMLFFKIYRNETKAFKDSVITDEVNTIEFGLFGFRFKNISRPLGLYQFWTNCGEMLLDEKPNSDAGALRIGF